MGGGGWGEVVSQQSGGGPVVVTTAAQLASMRPPDRQAHFDAAVITDLSRVNPDFLARVRDRLGQRIAAQDPSHSG